MGEYSNSPKRKYKKYKAIVSEVYNKNDYSRTFKMEKEQSHRKFVMLGDHSIINYNAIQYEVVSENFVVSDSQKSFSANYFH